ncbi:Intradiol ring-cleavage dioxygenase [Truncatella angustata]|uniref:Intradiol ring-cleavage dioxygenase n=1 Tax=Truncatella angustata TaxID=152316 RepID=A0A9P8UHT6_9PEZI|nr:Intradiol ring-cleavage dioxygenase [Truncatella angustata]KAH6652363.1 Intradiol ring-cleavage dioxygenase [Truncatella angustata]
MRFSAALIASVAATLVAAHPGADLKEELRERQEFIANSKRTNLGHCAAKHKARGIEQRAIARRHNVAMKNAKRGVLQRDPTDINKSHLSDAGFDNTTPLADIFAQNASCVLSPEETEGPYYVSGEYVRTDIREVQGGIPLYLDVAIYDVETCEPLPNRWFEIWHCNSTGVYAGVPSGGNFSSAPENLNNTFNRGFQQTDTDGAVQFLTNFPGHYSGRAIHIHVAVHPNATARDNGTIYDLTANHVGQIYFDQDLVDQVESYAPYNTNTQPITTNAEDFLLADGLATSDPIAQYVLLGEDVSEGLLGWFSFGVNTTYTRAINDAATYYEGGGVSNGGGGGPGGPGGPPPGAPPKI